MMAFYETTMEALKPTLRWSMDYSFEEDVRGHTTTVIDTPSYAGSIIPSLAGGSMLMTTSTQGLVPANSYLINEAAGGDYPWTARSISFWFNVDSTQGRQNLFEEGAGDNGWSLYIHDGDLVMVLGRDASVRGVLQTPISAAKTYHVVGVVDLTAATPWVELYLNGRQVAAGPAGVGSHLPEHAGNVSIGGASDVRDRDGVKVHHGAIGRMQDVAYWTEIALKPQHALALYAAGQGADLDLLASINRFPFDAVNNPGGLSVSGYLQEQNGQSLVTRAVRAMGSAIAQTSTIPTLDTIRPQADADAITALVAPAQSDAASTQITATQAKAHRPPLDFRFRL